MPLTVKIKGKLPTDDLIYAHQWQKKGPAGLQHRYERIIHNDGEPATINFS
jgi:hypothetical protein